jgi:hypothetical protein
MGQAEVSGHGPTGIRVKVQATPRNASLQSLRYPRIYPSHLGFAVLTGSGTDRRRTPNRCPCRLDDSVPAADAAGDRRPIPALENEESTSIGYS